MTGLTEDDVRRIIREERAERDLESRRRIYESLEPTRAKLRVGPTALEIEAQLLHALNSGSDGISREGIERILQLIEDARKPRPFDPTVSAGWDEIAQEMHEKAERAVKGAIFIKTPKPSA